MFKKSVSFSLTRSELKGTFILTKLKQKDKEWLLIKKRDKFAQPSYEIKPELTSEKSKALKH